MNTLLQSHYQSPPWLWMVDIVWAIAGQWQWYLQPSNSLDIRMNSVCLDRQWVRSTLCTNSERNIGSGNYHDIFSLFTS